jgi:hypothetical protein
MRGNASPSRSTRRALSAAAREMARAIFEFDNPLQRIVVLRIDDRKDAY